MEAVKLDPLLNLRGECLSVPKVFLLPVATISAPEILEEPEIIEAVAADWTSRGKTIQNVEQVRKAQRLETVIKYSSFTPTKKLTTWD